MNGAANTKRKGEGRRGAPGCTTSVAGIGSLLMTASPCSRSAAPAPADQSPEPEPEPEPEPDVSLRGPSRRLLAQHLGAGLLPLLTPLRPSERGAPAELAELAAGRAVEQADRHARPAERVHHRIERGRARAEQRLIAAQ